METLQKEIAQSPVTFTESAVNEIKRLMLTENISDDRALRVGVKGGGCSGMTYVLQFDNRSAEDVMLDVNGIPVLMNPAHELYLFGMQINFESGLNARGFTFQNPNATKTCGCGSSFSA